MHVVPVAAGPAAGAGTEEPRHLAGGGLLLHLQHGCRGLLLLPPVPGQVCVQCGGAVHRAAEGAAQQLQACRGQDGWGFDRMGGGE